MMCGPRLGQTELNFLPFCDYEYLCVELFHIGTDVLLISLLFTILIVRSDQGESRNLFSQNTKNANKTIELHVTFVFDDCSNFSAHKGSNN